MSEFKIMSDFSKEFQQKVSEMTIPFEMIAPHAAQAKINHQQTLERLNERGGLSPNEAVAVLRDEPWKPMDAKRAKELLITMEINFKTRQK